MKLVTVCGPPSSGKTSVIVKAAEHLKKQNIKPAVVKFDCVTTYDESIYMNAEIPVKVGLSGNLCPDHFFICNIEDAVQWGKSAGMDMLISESAGLCNRCAPHIRDVLSVCVIDCLSGINTPKKIGPMLRLADIIIITKGDIVSQAEREVFTFRVKQTNPRSDIITINGITGQGAGDFASLLIEANPVESLNEYSLRFTMPAALCSYCMGQTKIGEDYQRGYLKKMNW